MKTQLDRSWKWMLIGALVAVAACAADTGGDDDDDALPDKTYLTIVGDRDVFLENGWSHRLSVRYHDGNNEPLAGAVDFRVVGVAGGANLAKDTGVTNADGIVQVDLVAGATGEAVFKIEASAVNAQPVEWTIAVNAGTPPLPPLDTTGTFSMDNEFDIVSGLPGAAGDVINTFIDMTDDPYDPATFLLDFVRDEIGSSFIKGVLDAARPALDAFLNDLIKSYSPGIVTKLISVGDMLGQVTRKFGLTSTLVVAKVGGLEGNDLGATHTITGVVLRVNGVAYEYTMADLSLTNIVVQDVGFRMQNETKVFIDEHSFPLSYGSIVMVALNEIIIPLVDPTASNLEELLSNLVDCYTVGWELYYYLGFGTPSLYRGACEIGIAAAASEIENQIRAIDATGVLLTIHGDAKPQDTNTDRKVDVLLNGHWEGTISYAGTPATLVRDSNTFRGSRIAVP